MPRTNFRIIRFKRFIECSQNGCKAGISVRDNDSDSYLLSAIGDVEIVNYEMMIHALLEMLLMETDIISCRNTFLV